MKPSDPDRWSCMRQGIPRSLTCRSIFRQISDLQVTTQIITLNWNLEDEWAANLRGSGGSHSYISQRKITLNGNPGEEQAANLRGSGGSYSCTSQRKITLNWNLEDEWAANLRRSGGSHSFTTQQKITSERTVMPPEPTNLTAETPRCLKKMGQLRYIDISNS